MPLPSNELLLAVLGTDFLLSRKGDLLYFEGNKPRNMDKYELMYMMKEWAYSIYSKDIRTSRRTFGFVAKINFGEKTVGQQTADTEFEAVSAACEYILKESTW